MDTGTDRGNAVSALAAASVLGLGTLISHGFGLALVPAMLPRISDDLGVGYGALGAALAVGLVAYSIGAVTSGRIMALVPSRELLVGSFAVSGVGLVLSGAANSAAGLALGVVILGFIAPISWATTLHVAGATTLRKRRAAVMASASGGAALGVLINGTLVQTSESMHSWRVSFVIAALIALLPLVGGLIVYRDAVPRPRRHAPTGNFRRVLAAPAGRVVVLTSLVVGLAGFPFSVFLTATAIDEFRVSSLSAAAVWWLIGILGALGSPFLGRYSDRASPVRALAAIALAYFLGLVVLAVTWGYAGLLVAAVGFALLNYPVWGLVGALATEEFETTAAVAAISLGLVGASLAGSVGNAAAGALIDSSGSFRLAVVVMSVIVGFQALWYRGLIARDSGIRAE